MNFINELFLHIKISPKNNSNSKLFLYYGIKDRNMSDNFSTKTFKSQESGPI